MEPPRDDAIVFNLNKVTKTVAALTGLCVLLQGAFGVYWTVYLERRVDQKIDAMATSLRLEREAEIAKLRSQIEIEVAAQNQQRKHLRMLVRLSRRLNPAVFREIEAEEEALRRHSAEWDSRREGKD